MDGSQQQARRQLGILKSYLTLAEALEFSDEARIICESKHPYKILYCNKEWTKLTEWEQHEIEGRTLSVLHGPLTDKDVVTEMMHNVIFSGSGVANMVYYTKNGNPIYVTIRIQPLTSLDTYGDLRISHLMGWMEYTNQSKLDDTLDPQSSHSPHTSDMQPDKCTKKGSSRNSKPADTAWSFVHSDFQRNDRLDNKSKGVGSGGSSMTNSSGDDSSEDGNTSGGSTRESVVSDSRSSGGGSTEDSSKVSSGEGSSANSGNNSSTRSEGETTGSEGKANEKNCGQNIHSSESSHGFPQIHSNASIVSSSCTSSSNNTDEKSLPALPVTVGGYDPIDSRKNQKHYQGSDNPLPDSSSPTKRERDKDGVKGERKEKQDRKDIASTSESSTIEHTQ